MKIDDLLDRLERVRPKGSGGWTARCPAHKDHEPSLSIDQSDGAILLHCFAGCSTDAIVTSLGLSLADLFLEPRASAPVPNGAPTWYAIADQTGTTVARHKRVDQNGKKFMSWWLPEASEPGLNGLKTEALPLYGAHLLSTWPNDEPILICEGEKAALAAQIAGIPAVGSVTGAAGCPSVAVLAALAGRSCVLWPDNDKPGEMHMTRLGHRLLEAGITHIKWFTWTEAGAGGDAADYLATRSATLLRADLAHAYRWPVDRKEEQPEPSPIANGAAPEVDEFANIVSFAQLQHMVFPPIQWLIPDLMPQGACVIAAKSKIGKSWLALGLCLAVTMGGRALGSIPIAPSGRALYLDLEGTQQRIQARGRLILGNAVQDWPAALDIVTVWPRGKEGLAKIRRYVERHPDTRLVVIDILYEFRGGMNMKQNMYDFDRETVGPINALADELGITILLIHHTKKGKEDDVIDEMSGSSGLQSAVSTMWVLTRDQSGFIKLTLRGRDLNDTEPLALTWDADYYIHRLQGPASVLAMSEERRHILELLDDDEMHNIRDIAAEMGKSVPTISNMLKKLVADGLVDRPKVGYWARVRKADTR